MSQNLDRIHQSDATKNLRLAESELDKQVKRDWTLHVTKLVVARLRAVVSDVVRRLTSTDPLLIPEQLLSEMDDASVEFLNIVQSMEDLELDEEVDIDEHDRVADRLLLVASGLPPLRLLLGVEEIRKAADQFRRETNASLIPVKEELGQALSQLESVRKQTDGFTEEITRKQEESKAEADRLLETFREEVRGEAQGFINQANESLSHAQDAIQVATSAKDNVAQELEQAHSIFADLRDRHAREFSEVEAYRDIQHKEQTDRILGEIDQLKQQARSMLQEVAGAAWAEHYSTLSRLTH